MRAMLPLDVELMMGFMSGGRNGLSSLSSAPFPFSKDFSSSALVSLGFFLSGKKCKLTGHEYTMSSLQQLHVQLHYDGAAFTVNPGSAVADSL